MTLAAEAVMVADIAVADEEEIWASHVGLPLLVGWKKMLKSVCAPWSAGSSLISVGCC